MRDFFLVLALVACVGHGRRLQHLTQELQSTPTEIRSSLKRGDTYRRHDVFTGAAHSNKGITGSSTFELLESCAMLLRALSVSAAFKPSHNIRPLTNSMALNNRMRFGRMSDVSATVSSPALRIAITGTNSGIGQSAAKMLLEQGHTVYHACRTAEGAKEAVSKAGGGIPMVCDLADLASVKAFAEAICQQEPALDVLCLNSGVSPSRKAEAPKRTKDGFEETVGINHLGHFFLAQLMQPLLLSNRGRLVVTASSVHDPESAGGTVGGDPSTGATLGDLSGLGAVPDAAMVDGAAAFNGAKAYHDSKLCNVLFMREAHRRWGDAISVRSFNPGLITSTGLFRAARADNWLSASIFSFVAEKIAGFSQPVEVGGSRLAYMATASEADVPSGSYLSAPAATSKATTRADGFDAAQISKEARDDALAKRLWELSAQVVGLATKA